MEQADNAGLRSDAAAIWQAGLAAVRPGSLIHEALSIGNSDLLDTLKAADRILVVGAGKAGAAMAAAVETELASLLDRVEGVVNVPAEAVRPLRKIVLHAARPAGTNQPTAEGVAGTRRILELVPRAGRNDVALCLISGGGSALLPAPVDDVTLQDKQRVTGLLHACGATINEMNVVRKHLSKVKGGRLAQAFTGRSLVSLIISDVVSDPLDVIASGPTAPDPTTFADALGILEKYDLSDKVPQAVRQHLEKGATGRIPETPKSLPENVRNVVIGNNAGALAAAAARARELGYSVVNLGSNIEGETSPVAKRLAGVARSIAQDAQPAAAPACILSGGETTVTLHAGHGIGGRNQEFVLAAALELGERSLRDIVILSGGTDGEDGPTDAAGAIADSATLHAAARLGLDPQAFLTRHDAYHFFSGTQDLLRTGLTDTNVMDVRVILVGKPASNSSPR
jgi:hydroxypyruvate reductase/glycerate 2-kinase